MSDDELIARIAQRAADPARRTDLRDSAFSAWVQSMDIGEMVSTVQQVQEDLFKVVEGSGGRDPEVQSRVAAFSQLMHQPAAVDLPGVASPDVVADAERRLGFALPDLLRRCYLEVANGGFGPGLGILGLEGGWEFRGSDLIRMYRTYHDEGPFANWDWPHGVLPVADLGGGALACVDTRHPDAPVVVWDEDLDFDEEDEEASGVPTFTDEAPSLRAWLEAWLDS